MLTLKQVREIKGLSQQNVADILDMPKRTIEDWETGRRIAPEYVIKLITNKLLGIPSNQIEYELSYAVLEHSSIESIVFVGSKKACLRKEEELRRKLTDDQRLTCDYSVEKVSEYEKQCEYAESFYKYKRSLSEKDLTETVQIGDKLYAKYVLDFQKFYYN